MHITHIALALSSILALPLGLVVFRRNPKNPVYYSFALFIVLVACWPITIWQFQDATTLSAALFWDRMIYVLAIGVPPLLVFFAYVLTTQKIPPAWVNAVLIIPTAILGWLLFTTDWWIQEIILSPNNSLLNSVKLGPVYFIWMGHIAFFYVWGLYIFWKELRQATGIIRTQMKYILLASCLPLVFGTVPNAILPALGNYTLIWIGPLANVAMAVIIAYTILRHRLLDIRLVLARSMAYSALIVILATIYAFGLFVASTVFTRQQTTFTSVAVSTILALIIAFTFQPLLRVLEKVTNKIFYKDRYDETELLHQLVMMMASELRLKDLTTGLLAKLLGETHLGRGAFILVDKDKISHLNSQGYSAGPEFGEDEIKSLLGLTGITVFDELPETPLKELLRKKEISLVVPLKTKTEKVGLLILGERLSGDPYTDQDVRLLEIFAPQAAIAVENASAVEELLALDQAKSEFITVVSHQLRTPLSVARWDFELLLENAFGKIPVKARGIVENVYDSLMVLNSGLNDMMMAIEVEEKRTVLNFEETDFQKEVIDEALSVWKEKMKRRDIAVKVENDLSEPIKVDKRKVRSVVEIMLDNAIQYSPNGTEITLSAKSQEREGKRQVLVAVADQGMGVDPKDQETIGQKFYRGEMAKKIQPNGFGLGLFIAKAYISLHGGELAFRKNVPAGSVFYFTIPVK